MIVRLTTAQVRACQKAIPPWLASYWRDEARIVDAAGKMTEFELIPDAWQYIYDELVGQLQRHSERRSGPLFAGAHRIGQEMSRRARHPALDGAGMFGRQTESIPAWKSDDEYHPIHRPEAAFVILGPWWGTWKGQAYTRWEEVDVEPSSNPIFREDTYRRFYDLMHMVW